MSPEVQHKMLLGVQQFVCSSSDLAQLIELIHLQYVLPPNSVVYTGCVGDDDLAEQLKAANKREGLTDVYLVKKGEKTGACTVVITGNERSVYLFSAGLA